jgi:hypothetical protein
VCREYLVTSPAERCARLFEEPIDCIETPIHLGDVMVHTTHRIAGVSLESIPLVLALEWAENHSGKLEREESGVVMLTALIELAQGECGK